MPGRISASVKGIQVIGIQVIGIQVDICEGCYSAIALCRNNGVVGCIASISKLIATVTVLT